MGKTIRIAAIGLGWAVMNRHIPAIKRNKDFELVGVADSYKERAEELARDYPLPFASCTDNIDDISWLDQVDAITIGTPPQSHAKIAIQALNKGKHVLTEKPFAISVEEGEHMIKAAEDNKRILAIVHNLQFSRALQTFERHRKQGVFGNITSVAATQLGNPERHLPEWCNDLPMGLFFDESPHFYYLLHRIAGAMDLLDSHCVMGTEEGNTPHLVHLLYRAKNNIPVTIDCHFNSSISEWFIRVTGEKETAFVDLFRDIYIRLPNDKDHGVFNMLRTSLNAIGHHVWAHIPHSLALFRGHRDHGHDEIFARFAKAVKNNARPCDIYFEEALRILKYQEEAIKALKEHCFR